MNYIKIEELATLLNCSVQTINTWYKWKRYNPDHKLAELLPDYKQEGKRQTRYWKSDDVWKLVDFKRSIIHGRNGIMGDITQRRVKKGETNGKKEIRRRSKEVQQ